MTTDLERYKHVVITGASSGIGAALAIAYARADMRLSLSARHDARLRAVAERCEALGAMVDQAIVDVKDAAAMAEWLNRIDAEQAVDLLIANAGISGGTGKRGAESKDQVRDLFAVNVTGVLNSVEPLLPAMTQRGHGHIALMSSLAGFRGFPGAPAYCASKAAVRVYGEGLRGSLAERGVKVSVICPGFVESPMTAVNGYKMPFLMPVEKAAQRIQKGLKRGKGRIAFPVRAYIFAWLFAALPDFFAHHLLKKTPGKPSIE